MIYEVFKAETNIVGKTFFFLRHVPAVGGKVQWLRNNMAMQKMM